MKILARLLLTKYLERNNDKDITDSREGRKQQWSSLLSGLWSEHICHLEHGIDKVAIQLSSIFNFNQEICKKCHRLEHLSPNRRLNGVLRLSRCRKCCQYKLAILVQHCIEVHAPFKLKSLGRGYVSMSSVWYYKYDECSNMC